MLQEFVAQKIEARFSDVDETRLLRVQRQPGFRHPGLDPGQGRFGLFSGAAEDDKVVGITHHLVAALSHLVVQCVEIDIAQQRAEHRALQAPATGDQCLSPSRMPALGIPRSAPARGYR